MSDEFRGKVTIVVETDTRTTRQLEVHMKHLFDPVADIYRVYIVPTDEVPYDGEEMQNAQSS